MSTSYFKEWVHDLSQHCSTPALPGAQDTDAMLDRVIVLELLYQLDGRDNQSHPHHNTYTNLWHEYNKKLLS
tara:strand:- start:9 stop:224 length:216 start_codon:yes stop_codon:yes gene_type:complete